MSCQHHIENSIKALSILAVILAIGIISSPEITGRATTASAQTSATIQNYFAITASSNMTADGIQFNIASLPATYSNATGNYGDAGATENQTQYNISVSDNSNVAIDMCIKANESWLISGANNLTLGNYSWGNSTTNSLTLPDIDITSNFTTSYVKTGAVAVAAGGAVHFRFWLSVPAAQPAGTYTNTINFESVQTGNSCS